jgi:hypothetical protein
LADTFPESSWTTHHIFLPNGELLQASSSIWPILASFSQEDFLIYAAEKDPIIIQEVDETDAEYRFKIFVDRSDILSSNLPALLRKLGMPDNSEAFVFIGTERNDSI